MKNLRERVRRGETLFGCFLNLGSSLTAEIVGLAGFDWVLIDLEHGAGVERDLLAQMQALEHTPVAVIVRVESQLRQRIHRVLDYGAHGIMVPRVENGAVAKAAIAAMRYPPEGVRGVAQMVRACQFGAAASDYIHTANRNLLGVVQIESEEAVRNASEIAAVDGVDVLFIGPGDLTMAMGILGQYDHPRYREALEITAQAAARHSKIAGILIRGPEDYDQYSRLGYRFLACGSDGLLLRTAAQQLASELGRLRPAGSRSSVSRSGF